MLVGEAAGFAGIVVLAVEPAGFAEFPAAVVVVGVAVVVVGAAVEVMLPAVGAVAEAGRLVSGVGSGGSGLDKTLAMYSGSPASELRRYLYQVVRPSIQSFFCA